MNDCRRIRKLIDEADAPDSLAYEAAGHLNSCAGCRAFSEERAALRELLGSAARVTAPGDFDTVLQKRLRERTAQKTPWLAGRDGRFGLSWYLRVGAATAGLVVIAVLAQYGVFNTKPQVSSPSPKEDAARVAPQDTETPSNPSTLSTNTPPGIAVGSGGTVINGGRASDGIRLRRGARSMDAAVVLVRGEDGEIEVPLPRVTVGAQPLLYTSAGRAPVSAIKTSF